MYGGSFAVFKTTDAKQKAAWLFLKFFTEHCADRQVGQQVGLHAGARLGGRHDERTTLPRSPIAKEQFDTIVPYGYPEPSVRGEQEIRTFIEEAMTAAFEGVMTPKEALDEAVKKANEALANGRQ